jgi:hypothetical protein
MYTNINTDTAIEAFTFLLDSYSDEIPSNFPKVFFLKALTIVMDNNLFLFDDTYWLQTNGTAMGTPAACMYATISYGVHERTKIIPTFKNTLPFYKRFIDDVFGIWIPSSKSDDEAEWEEFKTILNSWGKLRWVVSERSLQTDYLDLTLTLKNGRISSKTFQKAMNLYLYLPPCSAHPTSCLKGLIVGNFLRFRRQNDDKNFSQLITNFAQHLFNRGHSLKSVLFQFNRAARLIDKKRLLKCCSTFHLQPKRNFLNLQNDSTPPTTPTPTQSNSISHRTLYIHWEYHPNGLQKDQIRSIYNSTLKDHDHFKTGMTIAISRPQNLRELLTKTELKEPEGSRASDYFAKLKNATKIPHL